MDDYISDSLDHLENAVSGLQVNSLLRPTCVSNVTTSNLINLQGQSRNMALIQKSSDELMHEMRNCFDRNFDKLEIYILKNIFHVPGDVCLKYGVCCCHRLFLSQTHKYAHKFIIYRMYPRLVLLLKLLKLKKTL